MIAEGSSSSSSQTPMSRGGASQRPGEPDLLAERRARRAAESPDSALLRRAEVAEATVATLESHIAGLQRRLQEAEGDRLRTFELAQRLERVEDALQAIRESHRRMALTIGELKDVTMRLRSLAETRPSPEPAGPRREEMAAALAAAVERLRARAGEVPPLPVAPDAPTAPSPGPSSAPPSGPAVSPLAAGSPAMSPPPAAGPPVAGSPATSPLAAGLSAAGPSAAGTGAAGASLTAKPHKHSMSLIGRLRAARKHRSEAR